MSDPLVAAPRPAYRLVPSRFPPIGLFDSVATAADAVSVMELVGWTNDRLVAERVRRLPRAEWVYGRPNASVVMAAFLHVAPKGMRFNSPELGAWYAASEIATAVAEVAHHLRREAVARSVKTMRRAYRSYVSTLLGDHVDIRGAAARRPDLYAPDSYDAAQRFGEAVRAGAGAGIVYDSLRRRGGCNLVAYRPANIVDVVQAEHFDVAVEAASRTIEVRRLAT